jgi:hypothetical protein
MSADIGPGGDAFVQDLIDRKVIFVTACDRPGCRAECAPHAFLEYAEPDAGWECGVGPFRLNFCPKHAGGGATATSSIFSTGRI